MRYQNLIYKISQYYPLLSLKEEKKFISLWQEKKDRKALDNLILTHLRLILPQAKAFFCYTQEKEELISAGIEGLMVAIDRFDLEKSARLATYALPWITLYMKEFVLDDQSLVAMSSLKRKLFFKWAYMKAKFGNQELSFQEVADILGISVIEAEALVEENKWSTHSLDQNFFSDSRSLDPFDENAPTEEDLIEQSDLYLYGILFQKALCVLTENEKTILQKRLCEEQAIPLEALAKEFDLSTERIRQIEKSSFEKLKKRLLLLQDTKNNTPC